MILTKSMSMGADAIGIQQVQHNQLSTQVEENLTIVQESTVSPQHEVD